MEEARLKKFFSKIVDVKPEELRALWLGFFFFFVVLAGYYVIRPIRDNIGAQQFENLWWMITVVLVAMIVANAIGVSVFMVACFSFVAVDFPPVVIVHSSFPSKPE